MCARRIAWRDMPVYSSPAAGRRLGTSDSEARAVFIFNRAGIEVEQATVGKIAESRVSPDGQILPTGRWIRGWLPIEGEH